MLGSSLYLEGSWKRSGDPLETPFTLTTALPAALLTTLSAVQGQAEEHPERVVDSAIQAIDVVIQRDPGSWFDEVDFSKPLDRSQQRVLMRNLAASSRIVLRDRLALP